MKIHVTGSTGFLGQELARLTGFQSPRAELLDEEAVRRTIVAAEPDVVIHTAYRQDGPGAREVIVVGTRHVAFAAKDADAALIHLSTDVVFDGLLGRPYNEADPPRPCSAYGQNKADAEAEVWASNVDALVVRTSLIVGGPNHAPSKHESTALEANATFYDNELRSPIQVTDLALALLELAEGGRRGILHLGGPDDLSRAELAELIAGHPVRRAPAPAGRPLDCRLDSSLSRTILRTPTRGVREVFAGQSATASRAAS